MTIVNYQILPLLFCAASDRRLGGGLERWLFAGADWFTPNTSIRWSVFKHTIGYTLHIEVTVVYLSDTSSTLDTSVIPPGNPTRFSHKKPVKVFVTGIKWKSNH